MKKVIALNLVAALILVALLSWSTTAQIGGGAKLAGTAKTARATGGGGGGTFPTTDTILDDFNRANADPLDGGHTQGFQGTLDGYLKVVSNKLEHSSSGASGFGSATYNTVFNADQYARLTIDTRIGGSQHCIVLRTNNAGASNVTGYRLCARTDDNDIQVYRFDNDSSATLLETFSQTIADGDALGATAAGTTITAYYKVGAGAWTALTPTVDGSAYTASGKVGAELTAGSIADDFGGGNQ